MEVTTIETALILSTLYAILVIVGYIPGLVTLIKDRDLTGVSNSFWYLVNTTVGISFYNLIILNQSKFQIYAVGLNLFLGLVCMFILNKKKYGNKGIVKGVGFIILLSIFVVALHKFPHISQLVATFSIILAYLGQILRFFRTKTSAGTSKWLYLIIGLGLSLLIVSMVITNTYLPIIITEGVNFLFIMICYLQSSYYARGN